LRIISPPIFYVCLCFLLIHGNQFAQNNDIDRSNHSLLWEISGNSLSSPSYLFGTFHNNALELFDQPDSVFYALNLAEAVSLEVDISKIMGEVDVIRNPHGKLPGSLKWLVQNPENVTYTQYGSDAGRPQFLDMYFNQVADQCQKQFYPLETLEEQMAISLNFGRKKTGFTPKNTYDLADMKRMYLEGDIEQLHDVTRESCLPFEGLYEDLIVKRNYVMARGIDTLVQRYRLFCAVGAAHLGGEEGIIPILEDMGYTLRRVTPVFSEQRSAFIDQIKSCDGYQFIDPVYGYILNLEGKPRQVVEKDGAHNLIYQELGQGNTFSVYTYHMEALQSLSQVWRNIQANLDIKTSRDFEKITLYNGTPAIQVFIEENSGEKYWIRFFVRNSITYILHATGGVRFLNSKRAPQFFERFRFLEANDQTLDTDYEVFHSPTKTLSVTMPSLGHEFGDSDREVQYWRRKSFNPISGETFFMYESILHNDYLMYNNDDFGAHLVEEFDKDSLEFFNERNTSLFAEKSFRAKFHGQTVRGKIRQFGNILHFVQYNGEDSIAAHEFISSMTYIPFEAPTTFRSIQKNDFSTKATISGFKKMPDLNQMNFRKMKHYALNDVERALTYEVIIKQYQPWSFIPTSIDSILSDQIAWPDSSLVPSKYEREFFSEGNTHNMNFKITFTSSRNVWKGRVSVSGQDIRLVTLTYPLNADSLYAHLPFIDSTIFEKNEVPTIQTPQFTAIQQQLNGDGEMRHDFKLFLAESNLNAATAWRLLSELEQIGTQRRDTDRGNSIRNILFQQVDTLLAPDAIFEFWKTSYLEENIDFSGHALYLFTKSNHPLLSSIISTLSQREVYPLNESLIQILPEEHITFQTNWVFFERVLLENSPNWQFFTALDSLVHIPFYRDFIQSEKFQNYCTQENHLQWVILRYINLLLKSGGTEEQLNKPFKNWDTSNPAKQGLGIAAKEVMGQNIKKRERKAIENNVFTAMGYALGASVFMNNMNTTDFLQSNELIAPVQIAGLLSYYHYLDEVEEEDHALHYQFNVQVTVAGTYQNYAIFQSIENGTIYHFARLIPEDNFIPSLDEIGKDTLYFEYNEPMNAARVMAILGKKLNE
jgi:uncharacterized protein YbaP (TraB family)